MKLQYISQATAAESQLEIIKNVCDAGCKWIQLREKIATGKVLEEMVESTVQYCKANKITIIINDHAELALKYQAHGVHLGKSDRSLKEARQLLGDDFIIGATANTFEDIQKIHDTGAANYVGLGPFRFTKTKKKLRPILGLEAYQTIIEQCKVARIYLPVVAIGGILLEDVSNIMQTGVTGIALSGLITHSKNRKEIISQLYSKL